MFSLAVQEMFRPHEKLGLVSAAALPSESSSRLLLPETMASAEFDVRGKQFLPLLSHGHGFFPVGVVTMAGTNHV